MDSKKIHDILATYDLGRLISISKLTSGYANTNFKISCSKGSFLLRFFRQQTRENILGEINLLSFLKRMSFPTAYAVAKIDGSFLNTDGNEITVIYNFIDGSEPTLNQQTVGEIAKATATLNTYTIDNFNKKNYVNIDLAKELILKFDKAKNQLPSLFKTYAEQVSDIAGIAKFDYPTGLIHSDIFPDNTIFYENELKAIIDFEEYCVDHLLFDVAMTINGFCFIENKINMDLCRVFLNEYNKIRPLVKIEIDNLKDYIRWTAVSMASWHLKNDLINTANKKQEQRVAELLQRSVDLKKVKFEIELR